MRLLDRQNILITGSLFKAATLKFIVLIVFSPQIHILLPPQDLYTHTEKPNMGRLHIMGSNVVNKIQLTFFDLDVLMIKFGV